MLPAGARLAACHAEGHLAHRGDGRVSTSNVGCDELVVWQRWQVVSLSSSCLHPGHQLSKAGLPCRRRRVGGQQRVCKIK